MPAENWEYLARCALEARRSDANHLARELEESFPEDKYWRLVAETYREAASLYDKALDHPLFTEEQEDEC